MGDRHDLGNAISGIIYGAPIGGLMGLGICVFIIDGTWFFPGDTILMGATVCGVLGYFFGEPFIEWLKEHWSDFW